MQFKSFAPLLAATLVAVQGTSSAQRFRVLPYSRSRSNFFLPSTIRAAVNAGPVDAAKREHKSEAFLEKQPFGQVPYLDDDGFILYESRAIARYIATKYKDQGTPLIPDPADLKATALFEQAVSVECSNFDPSASGIAMEKIFKL